jgi:hypothetical protein
MNPTSRASDDVAEQRCKKKNHEDKEQDFRDSSRRHRDARKSEDRRDQRDDKKPEGPPQHFAP